MIRTASRYSPEPNGGISGHGIGDVTAFAPAPPPPENQQGATATKPARARSLAHSTYCRANPCVPCRIRTAGNGPVPDGRATAACITPRSGTATLTHFTGRVSVPTGASIAVTDGCVFRGKGNVWATPGQADQSSMPAVMNIISCRFSIVGVGLRSAFSARRLPHRFSHGHARVGTGFVQGSGDALLIGRRSVLA